LIGSFKHFNNDEKANVICNSQDTWTLPITNDIQLKVGQGTLICFGSTYPEFTIQSLEPVEFPVEFKDADSFEVQDPVFVFNFTEGYVRNL